MTNLEALEKLYISMGGVESDLDDVSTTADIIPLLKDVIGGGGSGGGVLVVNSVDHPDEGRFYLDKTWQEIHDAFLQGTTIIVREEETYYNRLNLQTVGDCSISYNRPPSKDTVIYNVVTSTSSSSHFFCDEPNEYPHYYYGD